MYISHRRYRKIVHPKEDIHESQTRIIIPRRKNPPEALNS